MSLHTQDRQPSRTDSLAGCCTIRWNFFRVAGSSPSTYASNSFLWDEVNKRLGRIWLFLFIGGPILG